MPRVAANDDPPDDEKHADGEEQVQPSGPAVDERANGPDHQQHDSDENAQIHELTVGVPSLKLARQKWDATLGTENSVFEPTSPPSGFDNLSPTSCPQCGGRRKVGGEDLIIRLGFTKPSPDRTGPVAQVTGFCFSSAKTFGAAYS